VNAAEANHQNYMARKAETLEKDAAKRQVLARLEEEHRRALAWSRAAFPDRVEDGWPCPFAAVLAIEAVRRRPQENPSRGQIERRLLALVKRRGDVQDPWWPRVTANTTNEESVA